MGIFGSQEETNNENTYEQDVECDNCDNIETRDIPMGKTIEQYLTIASTKCENCGCNTLKKSEGVQE